MVDQTLRLIKKNQAKRILDVGVGSGCLSISILKERLYCKCDAIDLSKKDDIVCIAGKGHEKYQDVAGERLPFDDVSVAEEYLRASNSRLSEC